MRAACSPWARPPPSPPGERRAAGRRRRQQRTSTSTNNDATTRARSHPQSHTIALTQSHTTYFKKDQGWWWPLIYQQTSLNPPYAISFICAIRISNNLLRIINDYADQYKSLFMDEAFFSTMAFRNELSIVVAPELSTIEWRREWNLHEIKKTNLYHPMKSIDQQYEYRNLLG